MIAISPLPFVLFLLSSLGPLGVAALLLERATRVTWIPSERPRTGCELQETPVCEQSFSPSR